MKTMIPIYLLLAILSLTLATSCARKGFETSQLSKTTDENNGNGNGNNPPAGPSDLAEQISNLDMRSYVADGGFGSADPMTDPNPVTDLDKTGSGQLVIRLPLGVSSIFSVGAGGTHQKYKDITFAIEGNLKTGYRLVVKIPLKYILRTEQFETAAPGRLPNGDAIPAIPSGELPRLDITVNPNKKEKVYLYLNKNFVGILFESKFDPGFDLKYNLTDQNRLNTLGHFYLMQAKNNAPAAFMVLFPISDEVSTLLDKYFLK